MSPLTKRQAELLTLAAHGYNSNEISSVTGITPHTVRLILQSGRERLKARNTVHAVAIALTNNIVTLEEPHDTVKP